MIVIKIFCLLKLKSLLIFQKITLNILVNLKKIKNDKLKFN